LLDAQPTDGDDTKYKVIVVVFADLPADRAPGVFDEVLQQLAVRSYAEDGILFGPSYEGNEGTAIYNSSFRPFTSPVPFLFVRLGVVSDWKFFLDNEELLNLWARRFGESAVHALGSKSSPGRIEPRLPQTVPVADPWCLERRPMSPRHWPCLYVRRIPLGYCRRLGWCPCAGSCRPFFVR
jgi:hypothetical protein